MVSMNFVLIGFGVVKGLGLLAVVSSKVCLHGGQQVSFFCSSSVGFQAPEQHRTVLIGLRLVEIREQVTRLQKLCLFPVPRCALESCRHAFRRQLY
jgi:hypothetical protein